MPPELPLDSTSAVPRVAVLGNDAVLAARPATAVQLAHACQRAGYALVIPPSWGDELVAAECVRQLGERERAPAIYCACPRVKARLLAAGGELAPFLVPLAPPPVAAARYLRREYGAGNIHIKYIGDCPGAADEAIDARISPGDFLAAIARRGIDILRQPRVFDSVIPPDRRRHASLPGGLPTPELLWSLERRVVVELDDEEFLPELAQHLVAADRVLVDLAPRLGCSCSGATEVAGSDARRSILALEPPRAPQPPIDTTVDLQLAQPLPPVPSYAPPPAKEWPTANGSAGAPSEVSATTSIPPASTPEAPRAVRRVTPTSFFRAYATPVPQARSGEGRALPRAYVARRQSPIVLRAVASPEAGEGSSSGGASSGLPAPDERPPAPTAAEQTTHAPPATAVVTPHAPAPSGVSVGWTVLSRGDSQAALGESVQRAESAPAGEQREAPRDTPPVAPAAEQTTAHASAAEPPEENAIPKASAEHVATEAEPATPAGPDAAAGPAGETHADTAPPPRPTGTPSARVRQPHRVGLLLPAALAVGVVIALVVEVMEVIEAIEAIEGYASGRDEPRASPTPGRTSAADAVRDAASRARKTDRVDSEPG
jgi:hypothetical protein